MGAAGKSYPNKSINLLLLFYPHPLVQTEKETSWKKQGGCQEQVKSVTEVIPPAPRGNPHLCHCSSSQASSQRSSALISTAWQKVSVPENVKTIRKNRRERKPHEKENHESEKKYKGHKWKVNVPNTHSYCHNIYFWFALVCFSFKSMSSCCLL